MSEAAAPLVGDIPSDEYESMAEFMDDLEVTHKFHRKAIQMVT